MPSERTIMPREPTPTEDICRSADLHARRATPPCVCLYVCVNTKTTATNPYKLDRDAYLDPLPAHVGSEMRQKSRCSHPRKRQFSKVVGNAANPGS